MKQSAGVFFLSGQAHVLVLGRAGREPARAVSRLDLPRSRWGGEASVARGLIGAGRGVVAWPSAGTYLAFLPAPTPDARLLARMMPWAAEPFFPEPVEDVRTGFVPARAAPDGKPAVLAFGLPRRLMPEEAGAQDAWEPAAVSLLNGLLDRRGTDGPVVAVSLEEGCALALAADSKGMIAARILTPAPDAAALRAVLDEVLEAAGPQAPVFACSPGLEWLGGALAGRRVEEEDGLECRLRGAALRGLGLAKIPFTPSPGESRGEGEAAIAPALSRTLGLVLALLLLLAAWAWVSGRRACETNRRLDAQQESVFRRIMGPSARRVDAVRQLQARAGSPGASGGGLAADRCVGLLGRLDRAAASCAGGGLEIRRVRLAGGVLRVDGVCRTLEEAETFLAAVKAGFGAAQYDQLDARGGRGSVDFALSVRLAASGPAERGEP